MRNGGLGNDDFGSSFDKTRRTATFMGIVWMLIVAALGGGALWVAYQFIQTL